MKNLLPRIQSTLLLILSACTLSTAKAQMVDSMMNVYNLKYPQEKIHVHFDKSYYNPGETIWFKAYVMSGTGLSEISRNLYAELLDETGKVLERKVCPIVGSSAAASFDIPAPYSKQNIYFRAFTTWMLNFDTAFLYEKNIRIITAPAAKAASAANTTSLRFFPEGGDLAEGVESRLAFKANDRYGRPVTVKGFIRNKGGKKVSDFASVHNGMGYLDFTPLKGESYTAVWKDAAGKEQTTEIPAAKENGVVMRLTSNEGEVQFLLKKDSVKGEARRMVLMGHINQQIVYKAKINFAATSSTVKGSIPTDQFPSGIFQLTLFDDQERPLQERIVFINNNDYIFDAYVSPASKKLAKRAKNVLQIEVPDTLVSNLSISVTDADINMTDENEDNIYSRLMLTSEIKGYVHNPGYYFSSYADSVRRQLDLVMLTNGWRRFKWDDLAKGKEPEIKYMPEDYLSLKGTVSGIDPSRLPAGSVLNMIVQFKDSSKQMLFAPVDKTGKFNLGGLMFYDTASVYYQFNNDKGLASRVALNLDNGFLKRPYSVNPPALLNVAPTAVQDSVLARNKRLVEQYASIAAERAKKAKMLEEVVVKGRVKTNTEKMDERYASGMFRGGDGYSFDLINDPTAAISMSVFTYLQGRVAGLQISNEMSGSPTLTWRGGSPGLYLNEMQTDAQALSGISMNDIAYIKVFRPPFMGGAGGGGNGAIAIYTKKGGEQTVNDNSFKGLNTVKFSGYSPVKEFYAPNYEEYDPSHELNDVRTTLYWNPFLLFDKEKKKTTVSFFNNDITKKIRVIIEGVNVNGKMTRVEEVIQ